MSRRLARAESLPNDATPTRIGNLVFESKAALLRLKRTTADLLGDGPRRHWRGSRLADAQLLATIRSPLWTATGGDKDRALNAGKIHNLRLALDSLDGVEVGAGEVLSFWRQVGRPSRRRGFVEGRELREGCMIATTGGGLCQLSNALYEVAIDAGLEVVERHAHTRIVPGSRAEGDRDATVFWNYVDLRVRALSAVRIEVRFSADELEMGVRGAPGPVLKSEPDLRARAVAHDCLTCGRTSCHRHNPEVN